MSAASSRGSAGSSSGSSGRDSRSPGRSSSTRTAGRCSRPASPGRGASRTSARSARRRSNRSTSSAADSHARTSASPAREPVSPAPARVFGRSSPDSFASYDPATSSWRTSRPSSPGRASAGTGRRSEEFSETWPRHGMTRSGRAFPLGSSGHHTCEDGSCSSPTPKFSFPTPSAREPDSWRYVEVVDKDGNPPTHPNQRFYDRKTGRVVQKTLEHIALTWPTATASDGRKGYSSAPGGRRGRETLSGAINARALNRSERTGRLNPTWVEWLMGFPTGWTALPRSATPSSRRSPSGSGGGSSPTRRRR